MKNVACTARETYFVRLKRATAFCLCSSLFFFLFISSDDDGSFSFVNRTRTRLLISEDSPYDMYTRYLHAFTAFVTNRTSFEHFATSYLLHYTTIMLLGFVNTYVISRSFRPCLFRTTVTVVCAARVRYYTFLSFVSSLRTSFFRISPVHFTVVRNYRQYLCRTVRVLSCSFVMFAFRSSCVSLSAIF